MAEPSRRLQERLPCNAAADLHTLSGGHKVCALRVKDLGLGGALVETPVPLQRGVSYELRLRGGAFPARVAREAKGGAYGLVFTLTRAQEERLTALVDALRRGLWA